MNSRRRSNSDEAMMKFTSTLFPAALQIGRTRGTNRETTDLQGERDRRVQGLWGARENEQGKRTAADGRARKAAEWGEMESFWFFF